MAFKCIYLCRHRECWVWVNSHTGQLRNTPKERPNQDSEQTWEWHAVISVCFHTYKDAALRTSQMSPNNPSRITRATSLNLISHSQSLSSFSVHLAFPQMLEEEPVRWILLSLELPHMWEWGEDLGSLGTARSHTMVTMVWYWHVLRKHYLPSLLTNPNLSPSLLTATVTVHENPQPTSESMKTFQCTIYSA